MNEELKILVQSLISENARLRKDQQQPLQPHHDEKRTDTETGMEEARQQDVNVPPKCVDTTGRKYQPSPNSSGGAG